MKIIEARLTGKAYNTVSFYLSERKYVILLLSFMLLIFGNTFSFNQPMVGVPDIYQNLINGFIIFYNKKRHRIFFF